MEKQYNIKLTFGELNILLSHCIHDTKAKIKECKEGLIIAGLSKEDVDDNYRYTEQMLESLNRSVSQQLFDQGQTILGRNFQ